MEELNEYKMLEALIVDNPDLERLELLLDKFNIFEALGAVHVELRHSDFLAFLLNPNQSHGLKDTFTKLFLQKSIASAGGALPVSPIDFDIWDLDEILVLREWQNIDILLVDERNQFVVIIENKVESSEHSSQLRRYWEIVHQHYPASKILGFYLTPDGAQPSDEKYIPVSYEQVCQLVERLVDSRASTLGPDVRTIMQHYAQMLRRHIVSDSEIAELCRKIYRKHQRALDLIYEYRPDLQQAIREYLDALILATPGLELDHSSKSYIRFGIKAWDVPALLQGGGWTSSGRILLFEFNNWENKLTLYLIIGPGPVGVRQDLLNMAHIHKPPFRPAFKALGKSFNTIFQRQILAPNAYIDASMDDLRQEIKNKWGQFLDHELPAIQQVLQGQEMLWK